MATTAIRRHHNHRLFKKRYRENGRFQSNDQAWRLMDARMRSRTGTLCSCALCCTPRKTYGNSIRARTYQERHAMLTLEEEA